MTLRRLALAVLLSIGAAAVAGCSIPVREPAVPLTETERALPLGLPNARFFADADPAPMIAEAMAAIEREQAALRTAGKPASPLPPASFLAVSGGADNGAFGAGLINGRTTTGTRPEFRIATGVSTGARPDRAVRLSCSQSSPTGASSTLRVSCGLIHFGGPGVLPTLRIPAY